MVAMLEQGGLLAFAKGVTMAAAAWFGEEVETNLSQEIAEYILYSGMYADTGNRVAVQQIQKGGRLRYLLSRIFLPYKQLKMQYPNLEKYKILFPFYQVKRWIRLLFGRDAKNVSRELKANIAVTDEKKERVAKVLKELNL